jgi:hypothetical protein
MCVFDLVLPTDDTPAEETRVARREVGRKAVVIEEVTVNDLAQLRMGAARG